MPETIETADTLYDRLMRLKPQGLSTRAWTINAGVGSNFFDNVASGAPPREGELPRILAVVGITLGEFEGRVRAAPPSPPSAPPSLRFMPRRPETPAEAALVQLPPPAAEAPAPQDEENIAAPSPFADQTAEAIERWLEAQRQARAAGLDVNGVEGGRLVSDLARLALEIESRSR